MSDRREGGERGQSVKSTGERDTQIGRNTNLLDINLDYYYY